ncbi:MAG: hypothetical protein PHP14_00590 [Candidatus Pacebacteria bacterium]|nr:hypothetical protein [Candidatus Paceibacterota bacterium]
MRIISFMSKVPGKAFINGREMNLDELFILLQDPSVDTRGKKDIKSFLLTNGFNPNPSLSCGSIVVNGGMVSFLNGGLTFTKKLTEIPSGRIVYHPNGWCKHILQDDEIALIKRAKKRLELLK